MRFLLIPIAVVIVSGCTKKATAPEPDPYPYTGRWVGTYEIGYFTPTPPPAPLTLSIQTSGDVAGTGEWSGEWGGVWLQHTLTIEAAVNHKTGVITGTGELYILITLAEWTFDGPFTGTLDLSTNSGSGTFEWENQGTTNYIPWTVTKEEPPY